MKFLEKTVSQKLNSQTMESPEDVENAARFQISKQFLVYSHQDSPQITWLEKSHLNRNK